MAVKLWDDVETELARDIRQLALDMVRLETYADEARQRRQHERQAELLRDREAVVGRRSVLMRELWEERRR